MAIMIEIDIIKHMNIKIHTYLTTDRPDEDLEPLNQNEIAYILITYASFIENCAKTMYDYYEQNDKLTKLNYVTDSLVREFCSIDSEWLILTNEHTNDTIQVVLPSLNVIDEFVYNYILAKIKKFNETNYNI